MTFPSNKPQISPLPSGFYIDKSFISSKHALWYGVRVPDNPEPFITLISTHKRIDDALNAKVLAEEAYKSFTFSDVLEYGAAQPLLNRFVVSNFLKFYDKNYEAKEDPEDYDNLFALKNQSKGETEKDLLLAAENYTPDDSFLESWWVEIVATNPSGTEDNLPWHKYYGNPNEFYFFTLFSKSSNTPLILTSSTNSMYFYTSYVKAARMSDLLNDSGCDQISELPENLVKTIYHNCDISVERTNN